jgi:hypothetical protein
MGTIRFIVVLLACTFSSGANAVWEYSLAAQAAMTDGVVVVCQPYAPEQALKFQQDFEAKIGPEDRAKLTSIRASNPEYAEDIALMKNALAKQIVGEDDEKHDECVELIENNGDSSGISFFHDPTNDQRPPAPVTVSWRVDPNTKAFSAILSNPTSKRIDILVVMKNQCRHKSTQASFRLPRHTQMTIASVNNSAFDLGDELTIRSATFKPVTFVVH